MEVLDATSLAERLKWESKEYWLHLEAETPLEKYPAKQHARRVQEKLGVEAGLIYLQGQQAKNNEDSDMPAPFRQRRYFYYLSGCNETDCHMTYDIQHDILSLFIPRIDEKRVIWNGRGSTLAEALVRYDIDEVYYVDELSEFVGEWFHHSHNRGYLYALRDKQLPQRKATPRGSYMIDTSSLQPAMNLARMIKDEHEIKLIRKANDISSMAHRQVLAKVAKFKNEAQVEGLFLDECVSRQAKQQAYDPIAASGPNAGTLHYDANNEDFDDRQLMCLDAGCEYQLYASDITRTFPLSSSWPTKEAENTYKLVERMQESCIERLAPGVRYLDLHILAHQIAIDGLLTLGILHNGTKEEIYKAGTSRAFFPHGLGHHVGLEVHDVGQRELMSVRRGKPVFEQMPSLYPDSFHLPVFDPQMCHAPADPQSSHLEEGMVVTVEPGIYFSVYALQHFYLPSPIHSKYINVEVLQRYLPVGGVRIEDDILITSKGYENLTTAPKGEAMMSIIRGETELHDRIMRRTAAQHRQNIAEQPRLLRAPGIPTERPASILKPIARAATMPIEPKPRRSGDFEPFEGPSLFSNFKRSMTTDERIQQWQRDRDSAMAAQARLDATRRALSVCGDTTRGVKHVYLARESDQNPTPHFTAPRSMVLACKKCTILCETLDRLRKNLSLSEQSVAKPVPPIVNGKSVERKEMTSGSLDRLPTLIPLEMEAARRGGALNPEERSPKPIHSIPSASLAPRQRSPLPSATMQATQAQDPQDRMYRRSVERKVARDGAPKSSSPSFDAKSATPEPAQPQPQTDVLSRTLQDLKLQRQDPEMTSDRCTLGTEQPPAPPLPSLPSMNNRGSHIDRAEISDRVRLNHVNTYIAFLEHQLRKYPAEAEGKQQTERTKIEEKLKRLRAKQVALAASLE